MIKKYYFIFTALFVVAIGLYLSVFRVGLSIQSADWGNFGSYFSGLLNPILTAINILVFVRLTTVVSNLDDERAKRETRAQQDMLWMQFRKKEIDNFENAISRAVLSQDLWSGFASASEIRELAIPMKETDLYLYTFLKCKLSLFELAEGDAVVVRIRELKKRLTELHEKFTLGYSWKDEEISLVSELAANIISDLQMITLNKHLT